jgi:hypothetical protein
MIDKLAKLAIHRIPGPENAGPDGTNRALKNAGDVFIAEAIVLA